jgi:iron complex transport system permease protein
MSLRLALLGLLAVAALAASLGIGSLAIPPASVWAAITGDETGTAARVVLDLRLPRALAAFAVGGLLALAGALMQVLLRNPLADPYVLGISGGAAVAALGTMVVGAAGALVAPAAFVGALASMLLVFALARAAGGGGDRLLLTGVVVAAGWGAVISFLLAVAGERQVHGMLFWLMGDLSQPGDPLPALALLAVALLVALAAARSLNLLARGEQQAAVLGVAVPALRRGVYFGASLATAAAVTLAGSVGFVGLVIPHLMRLWVSSDHRWLLPAAVLAGGTLLTLADTLARTIIAPQQLPVGVLTALVGVPLFLYLLVRGRR